MSRTGTEMPDLARQVLVWPGWPYAPAPAYLLRAGRGTSWRAAGREPQGLTVSLLACELLRHAWLRASEVAMRGVARSLVPFAREPGRATAVDERPLCVVLPILPDLSHTFVYREVLALLRARPDTRVVCLERGHGPVHPEAAELLERVEFVPPQGITRRFLTVLGWALRAPRRFGALIRLYRDQPGGSTQDLFGKNPLRDPRHPGRAFALASHLRRDPPAQLHVYGSTYPANATLGAAMLLGVPFSISSYVDFDFGYDFKMLGEKLRRARFFRVVTAFCAQRLRELEPAAAGARIPVVLLGLDLDRWQDEAVPSGAGLLVSAARLVPKKGLHILPPALAQLRARGIPFRWLIAGDGPERERLQALVSEHGIADAVEFLGPVGNDEVRRRLLHADAAVLPCVVASDGERDGIPIFLTEAMALGVPVVTTPVSGIPELIEDGVNGLLASPGSAAALAAKLQQLLADSPGARAIGQRGRATVQAKLDVRDAANALLAQLDAGVPT